MIKPLRNYVHVVIDCNGCLRFFSELQRSIRNNNMYFFNRCLLYMFIFVLYYCCGCEKRQRRKRRHKTVSFLKESGCFFVLDFPFLSSFFFTNKTLKHMLRVSDTSFNVLNIEYHKHVYVSLMAKRYFFGNIDSVMLFFSLQIKKWRSWNR